MWFPRGFRRDSSDFELHFEPRSRIIRLNHDRESVENRGFWVQRINPVGDRRNQTLSFAPLGNGQQTSTTDIRLRRGLVPPPLATNRSIARKEGLWTTVIKRIQNITASPSHMPNDASDWPDQVGCRDFIGSWKKEPRNHTHAQTFLKFELTDKHTYSWYILVGEINVTSPFKRF